MKKITSYVIALVTMMLVLAGCTSTSNQKQVKILYTYSLQDNNTFRDKLAESARIEAESLGAQIDFVHPTSVEMQVKQIKEAAANNYDAIICIAENIDTTRQLIAAAGALPIVFINNEPEKDILVENQYIYVGSNEYDAGAYQAEYILEQLSSKQELNVVILKGDKNHSGTTGRTEAVKRGLMDGGKKVNIVFEDYAYWEPSIAEELFDIFLKTGKSVDVVVANNDAMAIGIINSMKKNGIDTSKVPVLGVDATAEGCAAIQSGDMQFTVYQSTAGQGEYAAKAAVALVNGQDIKELDYVDKDGKHIWIPFEKVTKSNVTEYMNK